MPVSNSVATTDYGIHYYGKGLIFAGEMNGKAAELISNYPINSEIKKLKTKRNRDTSLAE